MASQRCRGSGAVSVTNGFMTLGSMSGRLCLKLWSSDIMTHKRRVKPSLNAGAGVIFGGSSILVSQIVLSCNNVCCWREIAEDTSITGDRGVEAALCPQRVNLHEPCYRHNPQVPLRYFLFSGKRHTEVVPVTCLKSWLIWLYIIFKRWCCRLKIERLQWRAVPRDERCSTSYRTEHKCITEGRCL